MTVSIAHLFLAANAPPSNPAGALAIVGAITAGVRSKQPVGGWLFFFLYQIFAGVAVTALTTPWSRYRPHTWSSSGLYLVFALSTLPVFLALLAAALAAVRLLQTFQWQWVVVLRYTLMLYFLLVSVRILVDIAYFPSAVNQTAAGLIFPCICVPYLYQSARVRKTFGG